VNCTGVLCASRARTSSDASLDRIAAPHAIGDREMFDRRQAAGPDPVGRDRRMGVAPAEPGAVRNDPAFRGEPDRMGFGDRKPRIFRFNIVRHFDQSLSPSMSPDKISKN
jgi:hypothetical protein